MIFAVGGAMNVDSSGFALFEDEDALRVPESDDFRRRRGTAVATVFVAS